MRKNPTYWGRAGAGILFKTGDYFLLGLRSPRIANPNTWGIPGGAVGGETWAQSERGEEVDLPVESFFKQALQEVREEFGSLPDEIKEEDLIDIVKYQDGSFVYLNFIIELPEEIAEDWVLGPINHYENTQVSWFHKNSLPENLHFGVEYIFDQKPELLY